MPDCYLVKGETMRGFTHDQRQHMFGALWDHPEIGVGVVDTDGIFTGANAALGAALNRDPLEFIDVDMFELTEPGPDLHKEREMLGFAKDGLTPGYRMAKGFRRKMNGPVYGSVRLIRLNKEHRPTTDGEAAAFLLTFVPQRVTMLPTASDAGKISPAVRLWSFVSRRVGLVAMLTGWGAAIAAFAWQILKGAK